ncbi:MAG TPA: Uma2 family endonuclease [Blastocatellia bacterium]|nr:Uma2 family endonuclease [Blastocatellia bacterium]
MNAALLKTIPEPLELDSPVIRLGPLKQRMTDDEFFEFCVRNRELRIEMTKDGEMLIMPPVGSEGGHRNYKLIGRFMAWDEADGTGVGFDSSAGFKLPNGAKRSPDLSWIRRERWEAIPAGKRKKFAPICPDFVVELRSETDRLEMLKAKMEEYIENGTQLGWLIDPIEKKVYIHRPRTRVKVLNHPQTLSGEPLLKGLTLSLAGIID